MIDGELQERIDRYVLGDLDERERRALEEYIGRATAAERDAFARAVETAALLGASLPTRPPAADVWARVLAAVRSAPTSTSTREPLARPRARRLLPWVVAAAAALALVWALASRDGSERERAKQIARADAAEARLAVASQEVATARAQAAAAEDCRRELASLGGKGQFATHAVALLELPGTQLIPLEQAAAGKLGLAANAIYHRGVKQAYVVIAGLPAGGVNVEYEVWVVRAGHRELAGKAVPDADGRALLTVARPTLEPGVPGGFQVTDAAGNLLLASKIRI